MFRKKLVLLPFYLTDGDNKKQTAGVVMSSVTPDNKHFRGATVFVYFSKEFKVNPGILRKYKDFLSVYSSFGDNLTDLSRTFSNKDLLSEPDSFTTVVIREDRTWFDTLIQEYRKANGIKGIEAYTHNIEMSDFNSFFYSSENWLCGYKIDYVNIDYLQSSEKNFPEPLTLKENYEQFLLKFKNSIFFE